MAQCQGEKPQVGTRDEGGLVPGLVLLALLSLAGHAIFYGTSPVSQVQSPTKPVNKTVKLKQPKHNENQVRTKVLKLEKTITTAAGEITFIEVALNSPDNPIYGEKYGHVIRGTIKLRPEYTEVNGLDILLLQDEQVLTGRQVSQLNQVGAGQYQFLWAIAADGKNLPTSVLLRGIDVPVGEQHYSWQVEWLGWMANSKDDNGNIELSEQQAQAQIINGQVWQLQTIDYATGTVILTSNREGAGLEVVAATAINDRGENIMITPRLEGSQIYLPLGRTAFTENVRSIKLELVINKSGITVNTKLEL